MTTLASFNGTDGQSPEYPESSGVIVDGSGNLYGTTFLGGASGKGTVFEIPASTHTINTLVSFNGANGSGPGQLIADAASNLYGITSGGGSSNDGTIFMVDAGTHTLSTLATFNGANGAFSGRLIFDANGNMFGTTSGGGPSSDGTVFEVAAGTQTITTLATFNSFSTGSVPNGLVADAVGNLYGTTQSGGGQGKGGTVFRVAPGTNALSILASFTLGSGFSTAGLIVDAKGNLYGTTTSGGAGKGTVFEVSASTNALTTLAQFDGSNGANPHARLFADASGILYGTTANGGDLTLNSSVGDGTVFKLDAGTHTLTTLATFNGLNGASPLAGLFADANGNLYGTTNLGGANNMGTVFELSPVPEPSSIALAGCGLAVAMLVALRRLWPSIVNPTTDHR